MRRNAVCLFMSALVIVTASGCKKAGEKHVGMDPLGGTVDPYLEPVQQGSFDSVAYPTYGEAQPTETAYGPSTAMTPAQSRYHNVVKKDTLYALARMYYGDQRRWKDIYEANRATISDPDKIHVGQRLLIP